MKEKISLSEAFEKTGYLKKHIASEMGFSLEYYSVFVRRKTVTKPQALMIEKLTGLKIEEIDIEVK